MTTIAVIVTMSVEHEVEVDDQGLPGPEREKAQEAAADIVADMYGRQGFEVERHEWEAVE